MTPVQFGKVFIHYVFNCKLELSVSDERQVIVVNDFTAINKVYKLFI